MRWNQEELQYLADYYGLLSNEKIAAQLKRSQLTVARTATRRLGQHVMDSFYSASELARLLGLPSTGKITRWVKRGWLRGKKSPACSGQFKLWCFTEEDVVSCLSQHPWLVELKRMPEHYFRSIVREEWERDPWYTGEQAAPLLGVGLRTVSRYVGLGWLAAEGKPAAGGSQWIIRRSAIRAFLENDPRLQCQRETKSSSQQRCIISKGLPSRVSITWLIRCPHCGDMVQLTAPPMLSGPQVRDFFLEEHTNGRCTHGTECLIKLPRLVDQSAV